MQGGDWRAVSSLGLVVAGEAILAASLLFAVAGCGAASGESVKFQG